MIEDYKKKVQAQEAVKNPATAVRTMADILKDKKESVLLGGILEKEGKADLAGRLASGQLLENDIAELEDFRVQHQETKGKVEKLEKAITPETVGDFAKNNPEFQKILNLVGPEKAAKAINSQLIELAIKDTDKFDAMNRDVDTLTTYRKGPLKDLEDKIKKECEALGVSEQGFIDALALGDVTERDKALAKQVKDSYGRFKKIGNWFSNGKWAKEDAKGLAARQADMEVMILDLNKYIGAMGETLNVVSTENKEVRESLARELIEEKQPKKSPEAPFSSIKEEKKEVDTKWQAKKAEKQFDTMDETAQEALREEFRKEMVVEHKKKKPGDGFWSNMWSNIFDKFMGQHKLN